MSMTDECLTHLCRVGVLQLTSTVAIKDYELIFYIIG